MIELKNVSKTYRKGVQALKNISLFIADGEMVYLTGKSGSGKSTLLKLLYKGEDPSKGLVRVNDWNISKMDDRDTYKLRRDVGVVFQDFKLLPSLTVYENVAYVLEVIGKDPFEIEKAVMEALGMVNLVGKANMYPNQCSGGEQQRVAIARAICKNPSVLIADEPTGNLNPEIAEEIMRVFHRINKQGTTVVMATHNWKLIEQFPYRVLEMEEGELASDRSKNHISILVSEDFNERLYV
ncbi:cell division ATP-binding protein FtsE [Carnobacteriaceae bacterium 52-44]